MKTWHELTINPLAILNLYSTRPPLSCIEIFQISLERDASKLTLTIEGLPLPDKPPEKWKRHEYNKVLLTLDFFEIANMELSGWGHNNIAEFAVNENQKEGLLVKCQGSSINLKFTCRFFQVAKISPYLDGE